MLLTNTARDAVSEALATVLKALGNPTRLELIELLAQGERSVEAIATAKGLSLSTVSAHLQTLKRVGLVSTRRDRTTIFYRLAGDDVAELYAVATRVGLRHSPALRDTVTAFLEPDAPDREPTIAAAAVTAAMTVLDVRPRAEFDAGHFPGAISIPMAELLARRAELPAGSPVVVYCRGELCRDARDAARLLRDNGFQAVAMDDGVIEWRANKVVDLDASA
ncbi:ArsR/SmtB family transcription factor [Nocardia rhizosphaerae]|uniref:ArsR/SmtB family transcription factor n=1 Tax=Nocardia rhizosphaerae TaxID=1691571 RepID=A0ABV8LC22_9NOCA